MDIIVTRIEYEQFYRRYFGYKIKKSLAFIIILSAFLGIIFCGNSFDWIKVIAGSFITMIFLVSILYILPYVQSLLRIKRTINAIPGFLESKKLSKTEDGLQIETSSDIVKVPWGEIVSVISFDQYVILYFTNRIEMLISYRAFNSESEVKEFVNSIRIEISKYKILWSDSLSKKPNYKQGFFCLIPIIGFFLGIVFVILGVFKYKDKWLTLIGFFGILFTPIFYGTLFPELWNSRIRDENNIEIVQGCMISLIKDIEFYKVQNGVYPKSIDKIDNPLIYDLFQSEGKKNNYYNYKVIGDKYVLFSSGIDRLPNTVDDIYPDIDLEDSNVGLIRKSSETNKSFQVLKKEIEQK